MSLWTAQAVVWSLQLALNVSESGSTWFAGLSAIMVCASVFLVALARKTRVWFAPPGIAQTGKRWLVGGFDIG